MDPYDRETHLEKMRGGFGMHIDPKARLKIIVLEKYDENQPQTVVAQFNPKEVQNDASVPWTEKKGDLEYIHTAPQTMSFELMFDGFETNTSVVPDILNLQRLTQRMHKKGNDARPPKVRVIWGEKDESFNFPVFTAVVESVSVKYQMFGPDGAVLRATANVKLKEAANLRVGKEK